MNTKGEWTTGSHRLLRELMKEMKKQEDDRVDKTLDHRTKPKLKVVDMNTGATATLSADYVRGADFNQRIRQKRPTRLVEALLLEILDFSMRDSTIEYKKQFWENFREWVDQTELVQNHALWVSKHQTRIESIEKLIDKNLQNTMTLCSGKTHLRNMEVVEERHAKLNPDLVEGWEEPQEEQEWTH